MTSQPILVDIVYEMAKVIKEKLASSCY